MTLQTLGARAKELASCETCTLNNRTYVPIKVPLIPEHNILWVGQAPGGVEAITKVPFTGPAGKMHWSLCKTAGLNKDLMPHTNIAACDPPEDRKPTYTETVCCHERLKYEILALKPDLIIGLGDIAVTALTGSTRTITSLRGKFLDLRPEFGYECKVLCCYHPSYVMRQRQWIPIAAATYALVHRYFDDGVPEAPEPTFLSDPSAEELAEYLDTNQVVACDTETTSLNPRQGEILGYSFCKDFLSAAAVAFTGPDDPRWEVILEFFKDPKRKKSWQNGSFDISFAEEKGIEMNGFVFDTRLAEQLIYSDLPSDLDFLRAQWTNIQPYKLSKREMKRTGSWHKDRMLEYANWDAYTTYTVMKKQEEVLSPGQVKLMYELLIPLVYTISDIELRGMPVDVNALAALYVRCEPKIQEIEGHFKKFSINPRSPKQLKAFLDLKDTQEDTLKKALKRGHVKSELITLLLEHRGLAKLAGTYLEGIYNRLENGRIHTHFKIEGTGTGRLSSEDPNLQNVPEEMRVIYVAEPDHILVRGDYKQIELWVMAIEAEEDLLLKDLQDGVKVHYQMAQLCYPDVPIVHGDVRDFTHNQEYAGKAVTFGTCYGRSPRSIAMEFGVSVATAEMWQAECVTKYPKLAAYKKRCDRVYSATGQLETKFGRIRKSMTSKQGYNFPIQSTAADIMLRAMVLGHQKGLKLCLTVHDELVYQVPLARYNEQTKLIKSTMEHKVPELLNMSFKVDYETGRNWYEMEKEEL